MAIEQYKVEINPLEKDGVYKGATDYTEWVSRISEITRQVDDGDFDIGIFSFDTLKLDMIGDTGSITTSGKFFDVNSTSSIFKFKRDLAKVDVSFLDKNSTEHLQFSGLINDTACVDNINNGNSELVVISKAGIFNKNAVVGGAVSDGMTVKEALESLLNRPIITNYVNYDVANINPALNVTIDKGSELDNLSYKAALDKIMLASGSVLLIDSSGDIIVKDRSDNGNSAHNFYNAGDPLGRNNIIALAKYNTGVQRSFNFFEIDKTIAFNNDLINIYGLRKKNINVDDIITDIDTRQQIVDYYLDNFSYPKQELELDVQTEEAKNIQILDLCTLDYKEILKNTNPNTPFSFPDNTPVVLNKKTISANIGFKVIGIYIDPRSNKTRLKLREIGKNTKDNTI